MCELFAMSSLAPTTVHFSLEEFARHGGAPGPHRDGWGIAYYLDGDVRLVKEPSSAADSACVRFVQDHPFRTASVISHIRRATQGANLMRNCQPFVRELGGAMHVFAHNGNLDVASVRSRLRLGGPRPVGETDSEHAFCALLARLSELWLGDDGCPPLAERLAIVSDFAAEIRPMGPANFLYADGDAVFAHGHARTHAGEIRPPGLYFLSRSCAGEPELPSTPALTIETPHGDQHVVLFASVPLTGEPGWQPLRTGEILVARAGVIVTPAIAAPAPLESTVLARIRAQE
jgi:glutamine amidotransferase